MKTALDAFVASFIRTYVPWAVGGILGLFTSLNVPLDAEFATTLAVVVTLAFQFVYYGIARLFERYVSPKLGWLLGKPAQPAAYVGPARGDHTA